MLGINDSPSLFVNSDSVMLFGKFGISIVEAMRVMANAKSASLKEIIYSVLI
jgi:hypothetical protein